jgi:endonuclease-3
MRKKERYAIIIEYFSGKYPSAETELNYQNGYQLLVAVILSAQCTDKRVNLVTPQLFHHYPDFQSLSLAKPEDVFKLINSISYPNNKSKHLVGMANMIIHEFKGQLPMNVADLVKLPGVGRKTANVVTSVLDDQPNMAVDTHVFRVSHRLGLVTPKATTPLSTEKELIKNLPVEWVHKAHHWLILHGRYVCMARNPQCNLCGLSQHCMFYSKNK